MSQGKCDPEPSPRPTTPAWTIWLAPLASAVLLYLSFFPVACGWLAWIALVPMLCLVRANARPRRLYLAAWVGGLAFFWPALSWMPVADQRMYYTWAVLATYCAAYVPLVLYLVRLVDHRTRLPLVLTFPVVWIAIEYWRYGFLGSFVSMLSGGHLHDYPGGFGWYQLGHSQHDFLPLIQIADVTGVYGISFLIAAVNALLFEVLFTRAVFRRSILGIDWTDQRAGGNSPRRFGLLVHAICLSLLLLSVFAYGAWRLNENTQSPGPRLALLQGNLDQRIRSDTTRPEGEQREKARESMKEHFDRLATLAAGEKVDLIVWPETSVPGDWLEVAPGHPHPESMALALKLTSQWQTALLLGMNAGVLGHDGKPHAYNSAILLDRSGRLQGRYDKIHRVPFGEYIPLRKLLPWLERFAPYDYDYGVSPGEQFTRFVLRDPDAPVSDGTTSFGVVICYEDTDPAMALPYAGAHGLPPTDFLINISNDGWFNGSSEHDQHLAICRFRAIECRRAVARAVNMGISAVIDSNGRVLAPETTRNGDVCRWAIPEAASALPVSDWHRYKKVSGVLLATIPIDSRGSLYARWGDWFAISCGGVLLLTLIVLRLTRAFRGAV
jgi:apolipoprotein N-acyltransferase